MTGAGNHVVLRVRDAAGQHFDDGRRGGGVVGAGDDHGRDGDLAQPVGEVEAGDRVTGRRVTVRVRLREGVEQALRLGVVLGEWKGTSYRTKSLLSSGIVILAVGFSVMALGGK